MGNRISSIGTITLKEINALRNAITNLSIIPVKYDEYTLYEYGNNPVNIVGDNYNSQEIFTVIMIELFNMNNIISDRVLLEAATYFISNSKELYNNKYLLNVFIWYDVKHDIHLDNYELDQNILHTTNVHLIANDQDEKTKKIYVRNNLIFTLHTKTNSTGGTVIEVKDNTVICNLTRKMNRKIYDETIGKTGLKPNVITYHLTDTNNHYTLENGWFKIYFQNSVIEQLQVIPMYKTKHGIFSEKRNFTKQDYLELKRLAIKCPAK